MTRALAAELPAPLFELLDGRDLAQKEGETLLLLTVGEDGFPRIALLSVGEVLAVSPDELRLALWPASTTTSNLARTGRATLAAFLGGTAYDVELLARQLPELRTSRGHYARFAAEVRSARADAVSYAELLGGVRFRLKDAPRVVAGWERTIEALREDAEGAG